MADWLNITDTQVDPDAPLTSQLAYGLRDNPIAIAEGAVGAPKIAKPIYGARGASVTFTGLDDFSGASARFYNNGAAVTGSTVSVSFSDDGTTFYGSTVIYSSGGAVNSIVAGDFWIDFSSGDWVSTGVSDITGFHLTGTVSGISLDVVSIRFTTTGSGSQTSVSLAPNGGII